MLAWRFAESLAISEQAIELARSVGDGQAELRALMVLGSDLAYLAAPTRAWRSSATRCGSPRKAVIPSC